MMKADSRMKRADRIKKPTVPVIRRPLALTIGQREPRVQCGRVPSCLALVTHRTATQALLGVSPPIERCQGFNSGSHKKRPGNPGL